jgi:hypothetical protein
VKPTILILLALLVLAGCSCGANPAADPYMKVRSPFWFGGDPVLQPAGYATVVPQAVTYQAVPTAVPVQVMAAPAPVAAPACFPYPQTPPAGR